MLVCVDTDGFMLLSFLNLRFKRQKGIACEVNVTKLQFRNELQVIEQRDINEDHQISLLLWFIL